MTLQCPKEELPRRASGPVLLRSVIRALECTWTGHYTSVLTAVGCILELKLLLHAMIPVVPIVHMLHPGLAGLLPAGIKEVIAGEAAPARAPQEVHRQQADLFNVENMHDEVKTHNVHGGEGGSLCGPIEITRKEAGTTTAAKADVLRKYEGEELSKCSPTVQMDEGKRKLGETSGAIGREQQHKLPANTQLHWQARDSSVYTLTRASSITSSVRDAMNQVTTNINELAANISPIEDDQDCWRGKDDRMKQWPAQSR
eukprot:1708271-Amphidinium_carterae.1